MAPPTFQDLASHLCGYHPPVDLGTTQKLSDIRVAYQELIEKVAPLIPERSRESALAAGAIHDACQRTIAAVVLNQE